ncbi:MAG TPA: hypothetical protein VH393_10690 [Ktedonobacterales bacterium]|jgi:hypothetical protein
MGEQQGETRDATWDGVGDEGKVEEDREALRKRPPVGVAARLFFQRELAAGPRRVAEMMMLAREEGFSKATIERAAQGMVESYSEGQRGPWSMRLIASPADTGPHDEVTEEVTEEVTPVQSPALPQSPALSESEED